MPFGIGIWEVMILVMVLLLVFGPKRLPEMGRSIGRGVRELKDSLNKDEADEVTPLALPSPVSPVSPASVEVVQPEAGLKAGHV